MMRRALPFLLSALLGALLAQFVQPVTAQIFGLGAAVSHQWITGSTINANGDAVIARAQPASSDLSDSLPAHNVILAEGGATLFGYAAPGTSGWCFLSNGAGSDPSFQACPASGGTVNSGTVGQLAWYASSGAAVSGNTSLAWDSATSYFNDSGNLDVAGTVLFTGLASSSGGQPVCVTNSGNIGPCGTQLEYDSVNAAINTTLNLIVQGTGQSKIQGSLNVVGGPYLIGGTSGVNCSGTPTSSFATTGGIVTHC